MDDRGFIFTADASLALIVIFIVSASISAYIAAPYFQGQEHQHLQALASDTLETMEQDGTLTLAAVKYNQKDVTGANQILNSRLSLLIPSDTGYKLNMLGNDVRNDSRILVSDDTATAVRVISGPEEGYLGRAWYKQEEVLFEDQQVNVTRTVWNFHNYLGNFDPWHESDNSADLYNYPHWGYSSPYNIPFSIPEGASVTGGLFLLGTNNMSADRSTDKSFGADVIINGNHYVNTTTSFIPIYERANNGGWMYNWWNLINSGTLNPGQNNLHIDFRDLRKNYNYNMPWFSIIANYTTTVKVPEGILNLTDPEGDFPDAAGLAVYIDQNRANVTTYDLNTGQMNNFVANRVMNWNTYNNNRNKLDNFDDGVPFVIDNGYGDRGSAVSVIKEFNIPNNSRIFDGYVDVNAYAAVDNALVEVWDGTEWRAVFCSFRFRETPSSPYTEFSSRSDGYGNTPGTIYIGDKLHTGNNKVRITVWDNVPSTDYDLVGLVDSNVHVSYSSLPIKWDTYAFPSYQADSGQSSTFGGDVSNPSNGKYFTIGPDATLVYLFIGAGTTSRGINVEVRNRTNGWTSIYSSTTIPYMIDLASLDAGSGAHRFTSGTASNYTLHQGTEFRVRVTLTAPKAWESGDGASVSGGISTDTYGNPTIFSGTRIAVIYPKFLENVWATSFNSTAEAAKAQAKVELIEQLRQSGITVDPNTIQTEAIYTGNLPEAIPVRLDLWK